MSEINSEILSLIDEAIIIAKGCRIAFANKPSAHLLGSDCTGKKLSAVLGADIASVQASDFTANVYLSGKNCILRASKRDSITTIVLREEALDRELINDAFISSMRSSLNFLTVSAEHCRSLLEEESNPVLKGALSSLTKSIYVMTRHISNLSYARSIFADSLEIFPELTDLVEICRSFSELAQSMLHIDIQVEAPPSLVCTVDIGLFSVLFSNLISNAVNHGKADRITVRLIDIGESVILAVSDNGIGIPPEKLGNVFERYRVPFSVGEMYSGVGLGLTVVRGIAGKHGGTLLLESRWGRGTAVRVSLRKSLAGVSLRSTSESAAICKELLVGLSDCIDEKNFGVEYMD